MDEEYDAIVLGTGLTECILSGILSLSGKKVLHLDRNGYYGGESASLNLEQMWEKFKGKGVKPPKGEFGQSRDWAIDLIPKFLMGNGKLVKILRCTGVTKYQTEFTVVEGSYVYKKGKNYKVPANLKEITSSPLMSFFEKLRVKKFLEYVQKYEQENPKTWNKMDCSKVPMKDIYKKYSVSADSIDFMGHACALYTTDEYLEKPAIEAMNRICLYYISLNMFKKSPYVYPMYGLGELPQLFARLCAVHGGTYMLNKPVTKLHYDQNGKVCGVESGGEIAKSKMVIGDPSYFMNEKDSKIKKTGKVIRVICILDHQVPNVGNSNSVQLILPQKQVNRKHDIYICCTSFQHKVASKGFYIAIVSTTIDSNCTNPEKEVEVGLKLLGDIKEKFVYVLDTYEPIHDGKKDGCYISKSYDATTHFESMANDVLDIYKRIHGKDYDYEKKDEEENKEQQ